MNRRQLLSFFKVIDSAHQPRQTVRQRSGVQVFEARVTAGLEPYVPNPDAPWDYTRAAHLLRRCCIGPKDSEIRQAVADGLDATITKLFTPFTPSFANISDYYDKEFDARVPDPSSPDFATYDAAKQRKSAEMWLFWLRAMLDSPVSLQEKMTMFWHNHFVSEAKVVYYPEPVVVQNHLFRMNFVGNFKTLAYKVTTDCAMLIYLDGIRNNLIGGRKEVNENYSRELLELFTTGVYDWDGNELYTQVDVHEGARALSGWFLATGTTAVGWYKPKGAFTQAWWDAGQKTYLGQTGNFGAQDVINIVFQQRALHVARYICTQLYIHFVYDVPDKAIVEEMAARLMTDNWELKPTIELLLRSAHFFDTTNIGAKYQSPVEYLLGTLRKLGITDIPDLEAAAAPRNVQFDCYQKMSTMGQAVYNPPNVAGWPGGRTWISTSSIPNRIKFLIDILEGKVKGPGANGKVYYKFDAIAFAKSLPDSNDIHKLCDNILQLLFNVKPSPVERERLYQVILAGGKDYEWNLDNPEQRAGERIISLITNAIQYAKFQLD